MTAPDAPDLLALLDRYERPLIRYAGSIVGDLDSARDVVQDVFIRWVRECDKGRVAGDSAHSANGHAPASADAGHPTPVAFHPEAWLFTVTRNRALDHLRKHRRVKPVELDEQKLEDGGDESLIPRILGGNPGRALMDKEIRARIDEALAELSENHRAVLVMRELEGLSYEEMAQAMDCSKGTIMSRLFHARQKLKQCLQRMLAREGEEPLGEPS